MNKEKDFFEFNINEHVFVRVTEKGQKILNEKHVIKLYYDRFIKNKEDEDGWSQWQLWSLMSDFGENIFLGCRPPFETTIRIPKKYLK